MLYTLPREPGLGPSNVVSAVLRITACLTLPARARITARPQMHDAMQASVANAKWGGPWGAGQRQGHNGAGG